MPARTMYYAYGKVLLSHAYICLLWSHHQESAQGKNKQSAQRNNQQHTQACSHCLVASIESVCVRSTGIGRVCIWSRSREAGLRPASLLVIIMIECICQLQRHAVHCHLVVQTDSQQPNSMAGSNPKPLLHDYNEAIL